MRNVCLLAFLLGIAACSSGSPISVEGCTKCSPLDGGKPDGGRDAGAREGDAGPDGGSVVDAGPTDGGGPDSGDDAGVVDGGSDGGPLTGNYCPDGSVVFNGEVFDLCASESLGANVPMEGVQIATLEAYSATLSDANGHYSICVPPSVPVTLVFTNPGYSTMYEAELLITTETPTLPPLIGEMQMPCSSAVRNYGLEDVNFDSNDASVYSVVISATNQPPCRPDAGFVGWTFQASLVDGGAGVGGPWPTDYFDSAGTLQSVSATFGVGEAFMFNIDPSAGYVSVTATNPALQSECSLLDSFGTLGGFTGRVYVAPGSFSFYPWALP